MLVRRLSAYSQLFVHGLCIGFAHDVGGGQHLYPDQLFAKLQL